MEALRIPVCVQTWQTELEKSQGQQSSYSFGAGESAAAAKLF